MSKGNPIVSTRVSRRTHERILAAVARHNDSDTNEQWRVSEWLHAAILELLDKPIRRKRSADKKRSGSGKPKS